MIQWHSYSSKAIKGFPMGDPHERSFPVYVPPGYEKTKGPYPVIFMLAGWGAKGSTYINESSAFDLPLPARFDQAISAGKMPAAIVVFPDGTSKLGCSQYVNSAAQGNYQDYLCDELVTWVDENFPTHRDSRFRIVAGHSSGGFGALVAGFMRPDVFKYVCSSAGDSFYEFSMYSQITKMIIEFEKSGGVEPFVKKFFAEPSRSSLPQSQMDVMLMLNMGSCYAPNVNKAPYFSDLFFDLRTGEILPEVWARYQAFDPVRMVARYRENIKSLSFIQLESGLQDQWGLQLGHRQLSRKFHDLGVKHELVEYPGGHGGHHWRFEDRLTKLLKMMV